jgi:hypothetical protein
MIRKVTHEQKKYLNQFERGLQLQIDKLMRTFEASLTKCQKKLENVENTLNDYVKHVKDEADREVSFAEGLVTKELRSKNIIAQWTNHFVAKSNHFSLDPISFGLARYAINIALCWNDISPEYFIDNGTHKDLVKLIAVNNELIVGPSILALTHLSLHHIMKYEIAIINVFPLLLKLMVESESAPILAQACKLISSLAILPSNKSPIANSGCLHGVLDLVMLYNKSFFDEEVQASALSAVVNVKIKEACTHLPRVSEPHLPPVHLCLFGFHVPVYSHAVIGKVKPVRAISNIIPIRNLVNAILNFSHLLWVCY